MNKKIIKITVLILLSLQFFQVKAYNSYELYLNKFVEINKSQIQILQNIVTTFNPYLPKFNQESKIAFLYFKKLIENNSNNSYYNNNTYTNTTSTNPYNPSNNTITTPTSNSKKVPFNGGVVRVDKLGNMQINEGGKWNYFFPICIYKGVGTLQSYKNIGFNCLANAWYASDIARAKTAGLKSMLIINPYLDVRGAGYSTVSGGSSRIITEINKIKSQGLSSSLIAYQFDNENEDRANKSGQKVLINKLKSADKDHPVYFLDGKIQDATNQKGISDIVGTYVHERVIAATGSAIHSTVGIEALEYNDNQPQPVVFAELNVGLEAGARIGRKMTPMAMGSVAKGAKGLVYWRDRPQSPVASQPWKNDLMKFKNDINKMMSMGLIQQNHFTNFKVHCGSSPNYSTDFFKSLAKPPFAADTRFDTGNLGTRKLNGEGYIIFSNRSGSNVNLNCTITGLGYTPRGLTDILNGGNGGTINGNQISVTVPAYHRKVVKLAK